MSVHLARRLIRVALSYGWVVILAGSLGANVYLARRVIGAHEAREPETVAVGTRLPPTGFRWLGHDTRRTIDYAAHTAGTIVYVFSPQCGWCWRNEPNLVALRACALRHRYGFEVVALISDGMSNYFAPESPPYDVLVDDSQQFRRATQIGGTPTTILVSADGLARAVWLGAYMGDTLKEISARFSCSLPGVRDARHSGQRK